MLFLPSLASGRLLSAGVHFENDVRLVSGDHSPDIELASGVQAHNEAGLLTHQPKLIGKDFVEVLLVEHRCLE